MQNSTKAWQENIMSDLKIKSTHGRKLRTFRTFKGTHGMEFYLSVIHDHTIRKYFTKFRLGDHKLQIEVGRHHNIPLAERICTRCCLGAVEDEYHALLHCNDYAQMRDCYFPKVRIWSPHIDMLSSEDKFAWLMNNLDEYIIVLTAKFISYIMKSHITK